MPMRDTVLEAPSRPAAYGRYGDKAARRTTAVGVAAVMGSAAFLGWLAADRPELFQLNLAVEPLALAMGPLFLALCVAVVRWPAAGLLLLVGLVYLNLSELLVRFHGLPSILQALVLPLLAAGLLSRGRSELSALATSPITWLLGGYLAVVLFSTTVAWDPDLADARSLELGKGLLVFLLVALLCSNPDRIRAAAWTLVGCAALLSALGILQTGLGDFSHSFGGLARFKDAQIYGDVFAPRIAGPLGDPNFFAQILLPPLALALALGSRGEDRREKASAYGAAAIVAVAILLTYSRGAALGMITVLMALVAARGFRRRDLGLAAAGLAFLVALSPQGFSERLSTLGEVFGGTDAAPLHLDSSLEERRLLTGTAWRMFLNHPMLGVGAGNYTVRFDDYADRVGSSAREYGDPEAPRYPHNLYLEIGSETGILGLMLFGAVIAVALWILARAKRRLDDRGDRTLAAVALGLQIGIASYLVTGLFLHGDFQRYLWVLLALAVSLDLLARGSGSEAARLETSPEAAP